MVYSTVCPKKTLKRLLKGKSAGFISCGQSTARKTFTTFGSVKGSELSAEHKGIGSRAIADTLKLLDGDKYKLEVSLFEIHSNQIKDLIALPANESKKQSNIFFVIIIGKKSIARMSSSILRKETSELKSDLGNAEIKGVMKTRIKEEGDLARIIGNAVLR